MKCMRILISHYLATNGGDWDEDTFDEIAATAGLSTQFVIKWYKNRKQKDQQTYQTLKQKAMSQLLFRVYNPKTGRYLNPKFKD